MKFPFITLAASTSAVAIIEDPLVAVGVGVLLALTGVTASWLMASEPMPGRFMAGRYLAAVIVSLLAFGLARLIFSDHLILMGVAGVSGLFLDTSLLIVEKQMRTRGKLDESTQRA